VEKKFSIDEPEGEARMSAERHRLSLVVAAETGVRVSLTLTKSLISRIFIDPDFAPCQVLAMSDQMANVRDLKTVVLSVELMFGCRVRAHSVG
jgi:hypothetical protein